MLVKMDCANAGGSTNINTLAIASIATNTSPTISVSDNNHETLYLYISTNSSNETTRGANTQISSATGCSYQEIDYKDNGSSFSSRLYKLTSCQSSVTISGTSTSAINKNMILFYS